MTTETTTPNAKAYPQLRFTINPHGYGYNRASVHAWQAPTLEQISKACPGLAQQIDGERHYLVPFEGELLPCTYGALERLYASAAA